MSTNKIPIYIDSTTNYSSIDTHGIPRVVRSIIKYSKSSGLEAGVECSPIVFRYKRFWVTSRTTPSRLPWPFFQIYRAGDKVYKSLEKRSYTISRRYERNVLVAGIMCLVAILKVIIDLCGDILNEIPFFMDFVTGKTRLFKPSGRCIIIVPDTSTTIPKEKILQLKALQKMGCTIIPIVHDLIPITHPQFCKSSSVSTFEKLLPEIVDVSTGIVVVSNSIKTTLQNYLTKCEIRKAEQFPIEVVYPGADFGNEMESVQAQYTIRSEIVELGDKPNLFLMVGSIEPRKGHSIAFEAFSKLWETNANYHLTIVGIETSLCEELINSIRAHPCYGKNLNLFTDANDKELDFCYEHADALVLASQVEGFGLPIVEAMRYQLPVIASDIDVFREIAGDGPVYFESGNARSLRNAVANFDVESARETSSAKWISWKEHTTTLLQTAISIDSNSRGKLN